jgi:hypothetical protein
VKRLMEFKRACGHTNGPAISDLSGNVLLQRAMNDALLEVLEELLFEMHRELFPRKEACEKGSKSTALCVGLWILKLWSRKWIVLTLTPSTANGNRHNRPMRQHYAELELLLGPFL